MHPAERIMSRSLQILLVEDNPADADLTLEALSGCGMEPEHRVVHAEQALVQALDDGGWDLVLCDYHLPRFNALDAIKWIRERDPDLPIIILSGAVGEEVAALAMREGANDFLVKDRLSRLGPAVRRELKQADLRREHRLARDQLRLAHVSLNGIEEAVYWTDPDGNFVMVNEAACVTLGYPRQELLAMTVHDVAPLFPREEWAGYWEELVRRKQFVVNSFNRRKDGTEFPAEIRVNYLRHEGREYNVAFVRDVTEQERVRAQLTQADRLASVGILAAGVAHEINNPLTYMLLHLTTIMDEQDEISRIIERCGDTASGEEELARAATRLRDIKELAREAHQGAERVQRIVRDLHTFSRAEEEGAAPVKVNDVLAGAVKLAHNQIRFRARLVQAYGDVPPVLGSEGKLAQVFLNLIVNAAQAIPEGDMEDNEISLRTWTADGSVFIDVADTGHGIAPIHQLHLFDPFFTTKDVGEGSGLGLSICHNFVTAMGGEIQVQSEQGEGTRMRVKLPAAPAEVTRSAAEPATRKAPATGGSGRVMVIDDEPAILRTVERLLSREHEVVTCATGKEALDRLATDPKFNVILCDLMMPGLTGMELHEALVQLDPALAERLVFITGGVFTERARTFLERVDNPLIEKPFDVREMKALVRAKVRADGADGADSGAIRATRPPPGRSPGR